MPRAIAFQHNDHVALDLVGDWLAARGFDIQVVESPKGDCAHAAPDFLAAEIAVILGATMGVYEEHAYPWIAAERALIRKRIAAGAPTLGLCFGSQIMASALGAQVVKGPKKEIGWHAIALTPAGEQSALAPLAGAAVMQWHGDTWELPAGARLLASSANYANQAFALGSNILGLQFHLEVTPNGLERWLDEGDRPELAEQGLTLEALRAQTATAAPRVKDAAIAMLDAWRAQWRRPGA